MSSCLLALLSFAAMCLALEMAASTAAKSELRWLLERAREQGQRYEEDGLAASSRYTRTLDSICPQEELDKWYQETLFPCWDKAEKALDMDPDKLVYRIQFRHYYCQRAKGHVQCVRDHGSDCYEEESKQQVVLNVVRRELERAVDHPDDLGRDFVAGCPLLRDGEAEVVRAYGGSDACTYAQLRERRERFRKCMADADEQLQAAETKNVANMESLTTAKTIIVLRHLCAFTRARSGECLSIIEDCISDDTTQKLRRDWLDLIRQLGEAVGIQDMLEFCSKFH